MDPGVTQSIPTRRGNNETVMRRRQRLVDESAIVGVIRLLRAAL